MEEVNAPLVRNHFKVIGVGGGGDAIVCFILIYKFKCLPCNEV